MLKKDVIGLELSLPSSSTSDSISDFILTVLCAVVVTLLNSKVHDSNAAVILFLI